MSFHLTEWLLFLAVVIPQTVAAQLLVPLPQKRIAVERHNGKAVFTGSEVDGKPGEPLLPFYTLTFKISSEAALKDIEVTLSEPTEETVAGTYIVEPARASGDSTRTDADLSSTGIIYTENRFFPSDYHDKVIYGKLRNTQLVSVTINPYKYNPITRKLKRLSGGYLSIVHRDGRTFSVVPISESDITSLYTAAGSRHERHLGKKNFTDDTTVNGAEASADVAGGYVIITTDGIVDSSAELQNLIDQKTGEGYSVHVVTDAVWGAAEADTRADNIRNWLKNHWETDAIHYVLLIGNPDPFIGDVPMKLSYYDVTVETFLDREIPTDFYYSELSGDWDINGDGYHGDRNTDYGVEGGADHYGEVAVGRLPYYGVMEDLDHIIRKSIDYKNATGKVWRKNALLTMTPTNEGNQAYPLGEAIKDSILVPASWNYFRIYERYNKYSETYLYQLDSLSPPVEQLHTTEDNVKAAWSSDSFGFVIWWTHGTSTQSVGSIFRSSSTRYLDDDHPSMVYQTSCSSAFPEDTNNLAYALLKQGAVTIAGPTRETNSYRGQTSFLNSPSNSGMGYTYTRYLIQEKMAVGDALLAVRANTSTNHWYPNILTYTIYGCPDLILDTEESAVTELHSVENRGVFASGKSSAWIDPGKRVLYFQTGTGVSGSIAKVCLFDLSGRVIFSEKNRAVYQGLVREHFSGLSEGSNRMLIASVTINGVSFFQKIIVR